MNDFGILYIGIIYYMDQIMVAYYVFDCFTMGFQVTFCSFVFMLLTFTGLSIVSVCLNYDVKCSVIKETSAKEDKTVIVRICYIMK